jgi:Mg2+ and Co2+ transporter CorA
VARVASKTHEKIMYAAQSLLAEKSKELVTLTEIQRSAGVSKATLYRDKDFLEWWKETEEPKSSKECENCAELSDLKELIKTQKSEIRTLRDSVSRTTTALAALVSQMNNEVRKRGPLYPIKQQPNEPT